MLSVLLDLLSVILSFFHASLLSCCCMYMDRLVECTCIFRNRAFLTISVYLAWPGRYWGESDLRSEVTIRNGVPKVGFRVNIDSGTLLGVYLIIILSRAAHNPDTV